MISKWRLKIRSLCFFFGQFFPCDIFSLRFICPRFLFPGNIFFARNFFPVLILLRNFQIQLSLSSLFRYLLYIYRLRWGFPLDNIPSDEEKLIASIFHLFWFQLTKENSLSLFSIIYVSVFKFILSILLKRGQWLWKSIELKSQ